MSDLHEELWAAGADRRKVEELEAEIARLWALNAELIVQNERIKHDWRMCAQCHFVWCDPKERMLKCPQCDLKDQLAAEAAEVKRLRALIAELVGAATRVQIELERRHEIHQRSEPWRAAAYGDLARQLLDGVTRATANRASIVPADSETA